MEAIENTAINRKRQRAGMFVPADVLKSFDAKYLDARWCRALVMERLHHVGQFDANKCPRCGADIPERQMHSFWDCKRIKCSHCGKYFTALTGTFLSGCHFSFPEIVLLAFMLALGVADKQIAATLKISADNVRLWKLKFNDKSGK